MTHRWIDTGSVRLHVAEAGSGPPLLLIHGWPQHWGCFAGLIPALAEHRRVLALDLRGFGWSDAPRDGYDMDTLAADALGVLDALGVERADVVAHDWGGVAGFHLCLAAPHRVRRYVALNTGHLWATPSRSVARHLWRLYWYQWAIMAPGLNRAAIPALAAGIARMCVRYGAWTPGMAASYRAQFREPARVHATAALYRAFLLRELPAILRGRWRGERLRVPTLFLHGVADPVISPHLVRGFAGEADDFRMEFLRRVGHFTPEEAPRRVLTRVMQFLDEGESEWDPAERPLPQSSLA